MNVKHNGCGIYYVGQRVQYKGNPGRIVAINDDGDAMIRLETMKEFWIDHAIFAGLKRVSRSEF